MNPSHCTTPITVATLAEYWLGELDELGEARVEEHLLGCGRCSRTLEELVELGAGVRALVARGALPTVVTDDFVAQLAGRGVRLREYRVARNGSVFCTIAPDDDLVIARLDAPLDDVERLDLLLLDADGNGSARLEDIPFNRDAAQVVMVSKTEHLRALPDTTVRMQLVAVERGHQRLVGDYAFIHSPWPTD